MMADPYPGLQFSNKKERETHNLDESAENYKWGKKRQSKKHCIQDDSTYITFLKRQNCRNGNRLVVAGVGGMFRKGGGGREGSGY